MNYALKEVANLVGLYMAEIAAAKDGGAPASVIDRLSKRLDQLVEAIEKLEEEAESILQKYEL